MTDTQTLIIGLSMFAGLIYIPLVWLVYRTQQALHRACGGSYRENDRERRDMYDMLKRMLESQGAGPTLAMQQHAVERMERMRLETSLEREQLRNERGFVPQEAAPENGGPTEDITLGLD